MVMPAIGPESRPNLAVALNCGIGSSFLNALVKALERLHMVRAENSGYSARNRAGGLPAAGSVGRRGRRQ